MKHLKNLVLLNILAVVGVLISCGDGGGSDEPSDKEVTLEALKGSWSLDTSSDLLDSGVDPSAVSVTVTSTGFTLTGLESYVTGGSFTVAEDGSLTDGSVSVNESGDLSLVDGTSSIQMNSNSKITVMFETTAADDGRISGVGVWTLVFVKAS